MLADHLALYLDGPDVVRWTVGRVAAPLFFLLAGALVTRCTWRHGWLFFGAWLLLPPERIPDGVLPMIAVGCVVVVAARRWGAVPVGLLGCVIAATALPLHGYVTPLTVATCLLGAHLGRPVLTVWGSKLPPWFAVCGRYPLTFYVTHLWVLHWIGSRWLGVSP